MNNRIKEILSWYGSENPGTLRNLYQILVDGKTRGYRENGHTSGGPGF